MIRSFKHRGLKALYDGRTARRVTAAHVEKLRDILAVLDRSRGPDDMNIPGFRLHPLKGSLSGHWAVSVRWHERPWAEFAILFRNTRQSALEHERSKAELKALMPEDAKEASGHGVRGKRSKSGAVSFDLLKEEASDAALQ